MGFRHRILIFILMGWTTLPVQAVWSPDWPLTDAAAYQDNYATYVSNLYYATRERVQATLRTNYAAWCTDEHGYSYATPLFTNWTISAPYYIGVTNDTTMVKIPFSGESDTGYDYPSEYWITDPDWTWDAAGKYITPYQTEMYRYDQIYTNYHWITNTWLALTYRVSGHHTNTITNVVYREVVRVAGNWQTNIVYETERPRLVPYARWVVTGIASNLYAQGYVNAAGNQAYSYTYTTTNWVVAASDAWLHKMGYAYTQATNVVNAVLPFYIWDQVTRSYVRTNVSFAYTNYVFQQAWTTVAVLPTYYPSAVSISGSFTPSSTVTFTNTYRVYTNVFETGMDQATFDCRFPNGYPSVAVSAVKRITEALADCVPRYAVHTNAVGTSFETYYAGPVYRWGFGETQTWATTGSQWPTQWVSLPRGAAYRTSVGPVDWFTNPPMTTWTLTNLLEAVGSGTNLYRNTIAINSAVYPNRGGEGYQSNNAPFTVTLGEGWQYGQMTNLWATSSVSLWTNQLGAAAWLAMTNHVMHTVLGQLDAVPFEETELTACGFSPVFWFSDTGGLQVVTNQTWLPGVNGQTFTREFVQLPTATYSDYTGTNSFTPTLIYYTPTTSNAFLFPLVNRVTRFSSYDSHEYVNWDWPNDILNKTAAGEYGGDHWFLCDNYSNGLYIATNWSVLFGYNDQVVADHLHRIGYPTKVVDNRIGWRSCGPSGEYSSGGLFRPEQYEVWLTYTDRQRIGRGTGWTNWLDAAAPYATPRMTWDTLTGWPFCTFEKQMPRATTTVLPTMVITNSGYVMYADDLGALKGYSNDVVQSNVVTLTGTNVQGCPLALVDCTLHTLTDAVVTAWCGPIIGSQTAPCTSPQYTYRDVWQDLPAPGYWQYFASTNGGGYPAWDGLWSRDEVWNCTTDQVYNPYHTAAIDAVLTNIVGLTTNKIVAHTNSHGHVSYETVVIPYTNALGKQYKVTNIVVKASLRLTNDYMNVELNKNAGGTRILITVATNLSLYAVHDTDWPDLLTPTSLDARYRVINALKWTALKCSVVNVHGRDITIAGRTVDNSGNTEVGGTPTPILGAQDIDTGCGGLSGDDTSWGALWDLGGFNGYGHQWWYSAQLGIPYSTWGIVTNKAGLGILDRYWANVSSRGPGVTRNDTVYKGSIGSTTNGQGYWSTNVALTLFSATNSPATVDLYAYSVYKPYITLETTITGTNFNFDPDDTLSGNMYLDSSKFTNSMAYTPTPMIPGLYTNKKYLVMSITWNPADPKVTTNLNVDQGALPAMAPVHIGTYGAPLIKSYTWPSADTATHTLQRDVWQYPPNEYRLLGFDTITRWVFEYHD